MDRRQSRSPVTALQFWLGIVCSVLIILGTAWKVGKWTGQVDMSVQQLNTSVGDFKTVAETIVREHNQMRLDIQHNTDVTDSIQGKYRIPSPVPRFEGHTVK